MQALQERLAQLEASISQANNAEEAYILLMEKLSIEERLARIDN